MAGQVKDKEALQRLSFLYQVRGRGDPARCPGPGGLQWAARVRAGPPPELRCLPPSLPQAAHCVLARSPDGQELARFYCHTQRSVSRRLVLRQ